LTTYSGISTGSESGAVLIAGDPDNSLLVIVQTSEEPHFAQLTADEIDLLKNWITEGAPE